MMLYGQLVHALISQQFRIIFPVLHAMHPFFLPDVKRLRRFAFGPIVQKALVIAIIITGYR